MTNFLTVTDWQEKAHQIAKDRGWWPEDRVQKAREHDPDLLGAQLALMHSEVSEALEAVRIGDMELRYTEDGKPEGFGIEIADVVIRCLQLSELLGISLESLMYIKCNYNETRPHKHGGKAI
jgi:NTP pyrophosphatase (non-canonical NTP hydrolase)